MTVSEGFSAQLRKPAVLLALVCLVAVIAFVPSVTGDWIYDDRPLIANNPYTHSLSWWPRWFLTDFWDVSEEVVRFGSRIIYYRPAVTLTYAVDWQIGGGSPVWFHVANLLWHALASGLGFVVLRRWLGGAALPAFAAAVIFAVHPTKAENVAWIAGRTDVLCTIACLLVTQAVARRLRGARGGIALEVFATLAAYASKEQAIVLPAFVAIEYWVARGRPPLDAKVVLQAIKGAAPQLAVAVAYLAIRKVVLPIQAVDVESQVPLVDNVKIVLESLGRYVALTFAPYELSIQQGLVRISDAEVVRSLPYMLIGGASLIGLIAAAVLARRRFPVVTIGIAFYLATLSPTLNIVYTDMLTLISERFLYMPMLGIALVAGWLVQRCPRRWCAVAASVVALALGAQAMNRSADYRDEETFWARERVLHPDSREARMFFINRAIVEKHYASAMVEILKLTDNPINHPPVVALRLAQILAGLIPDKDRDGLLKVDAFASDLRERKPPAAAIAIRNLTFSIPTTTQAFARKYPAIKLPLLALRADLASRLGDDARAIELAQQGLAECPRCVETASIAAIVLARAGRYDEGDAILDSLRTIVLDEHLRTVRSLLAAGRAERDRGLGLQGPAALQAQAAELAALEAWGRAYDVLAPYREQIKQAPKMVDGFAELAVRAGVPEVAREVLTGRIPAAELDRRIEDWSNKMGWR